ncbi:MAG: peptidogalycan biosysnthesis protein, partial [Dokdonella sp.]
IARGFLPTRTRSFHYIADHGFRQAIAEYLARETPSRRAWSDELMSHSPYRETILDSRRPNDRDDAGESAA